MHKAMIHRVRGVALALRHAAECAIHRAKPQQTFQNRVVNSSGSRADITEALAHFLTGETEFRSSTAALVFEIDDFSKLEEVYDRDVTEALLAKVCIRVAPHLRASDVLARIEAHRFAIALSPHRRLDLEATIELATRLQRVMSDPFVVESKIIHTTVSAGFAMAAQAETHSAKQLLRAANIAQLEASRAGPGAIRSYSSAMHRRIKFRDDLIGEVLSAVEKGQITAYFQPQINLQTLQVAGLEALARWEHPERGIIPPAEFLPAFEQAGLMRLLGNKMLSDSLAALAAWDKAGLFVPKVSINMSNTELRNPNLVDHIMMELDRFDTTADRLVIEVLETVVASNGEDIIERNLNALANLGCEIDLDDFGTGHASITSIRKFSVNRIKIDRSFVTHIDKDKEQQNMASAILTMADGLTLTTLAEGVETLKEQAQLTAMGCGFMQGYALSHPLNLHDATAWISQYESSQYGPGHLRRVQ
tara:strand:+ start:5781 stop:7211 length:1431 start_codon:yes stop_codon:yes gene_type:complete